MDSVQVLKQRRKVRPRIVGWREWVSLPELGIKKIKVKVDTGARTSALHAVNMEFYLERGERWVRFDVHPLQRNNKKAVTCMAPILEYRLVKDTSGRRTRRPVIQTMLSIGDQTRTIEVTLIPRDSMGFRMLLGRQACRNAFLVNPAKSYLAKKKGF